MRKKEGPRKRATEITPDHMEIIREYGEAARKSLDLRGIHWWPEPENAGKYQEEEDLFDD